MFPDDEQPVLVDWIDVSDLVPVPRRSIENGEL